MKKFIQSVAALSLLVGAIACSGISNVDFEAKSVVSRQRTSIMIRDVNVTQNEAVGVANMFIRSNAGDVMLPTKGAFSNTKMIRSTETVREDGQDLMYVFNYEGGGFVIVGSTRNYYPILAYSDEGTFNLKEDMGPVDVWLDETKVNIKNSSGLSKETKAQMKTLWARYDGTYIEHSPIDYAARRPQTRSTGEDACWERIETLQSLYGSLGWTFLPLSQVEDYFTDLGYEDEYDEMCYSAGQNHSALSETVIGYKGGTLSTTQVGPLLSTEWHQGSPFNNMCPNNKPAGCGAIAIAQVMKYYEYLSSMTWDGVTFGWTNIPYYPDGNSNQARLVRLIGYRANMTYGNNGSWTIPGNVEYALASFGYNADLDYYSILNARNNIYLYNQPVIMVGNSNNVPLPNPLNYIGDSHYWVCEGAKETTDPGIRFFTGNQPYGAGTFTQGLYSYSSPGTLGGAVYLSFYMNWGWGGSYDGWFASNNVNSGNGNFQYSRQNIYIEEP